MGVDTEADRLDGPPWLFFTYTLYIRYTDNIKKKDIFYEI